MKTSHKGFISPLLLALIALLLIGGGAYVYVQTKSVDKTSENSSMPAGLVLPPNCKVVGSAGDTDQSSRAALIFGQWLIDCGSQNNNNARGTLGPVLEKQGWGLCESGLAHAVWWKEGVVTEVVESSDRVSFRIDQMKGSDCRQLGPTGVSGMSKYTDTDFGFSFWYPGSWRVAVGHYGVELYDSQGKDTYLGIEKSNPANGKVFLPGYACGPAAGCADLTYYFDASLHTWMEKDGTQTPVPADVSTNTMGGLHMLNGNIRFGLSTVVPLSAHKFLTVNASPGGLGGGEHNFQDYLAKTIVATDPAVATPVSAAEQIKVIQAEKNAYVPDLRIDSVVPVPVSIGSSITIKGSNFDWIPPVPCEGNGCAMRSEQPVSVTLTNSNNQSQVLWLGNRNSISTITVTIPSGQPCVFANGTGGCARGAYVITPGQYSLRVSVDGKGTSNSVPITITN